MIHAYDALPALNELLRELTAWFDPVSPESARSRGSALWLLHRHRSWSGGSQRFSDQPCSSSSSWLMADGVQVYCHGQEGRFLGL